MDHWVSNVCVDPYWVCDRMRAYLSGRLAFSVLTRGTVVVAVDDRDLLEDDEVSRILREASLESLEWRVRTTLDENWLVELGSDRICALLKKSFASERWREIYADTQFEDAADLPERTLAIGYYARANAIADAATGRVVARVRRADGR